MLTGHNFSHCAGPGLCLLSSAQHPQGEQGVSGSEDIQTGTVAKPETRLSTVSVGPIVKKKQWKQKSIHLVREEEAAPEREQESERQPVVQHSSHKNRRGKRQES